MNEEFMITRGSKYRVNHGDEEFTVGVFRGLSVIGNDTAMVFELEDGVLRFISSAQIIFMDLLEQAPDAEVPRKVETGSVYYG
ncbi:MAG: hypothetical protein IJ026_03095 [Candidatus Methanomethylophilaceae archaeon]|nr:hypothetical protein [Candidatus Methanomethylophilaceae archaeon]